MNLLLDTNAFIWALSNPGALDAKTHALLLDPANIVYFSETSLHEIAIKISVGKFARTKMPSHFVRRAYQAGFLECDLTKDTYDAYAELPLYHRDPFDRMIIALAIRNNMTVMTSDRIFTRYPVSVHLL